MNRISKLLLSIVLLAASQATFGENTNQPKLPGKVSNGLNSILNNENKEVVVDQTVIDILKPNEKIENPSKKPQPNLTKHAKGKVTEDLDNILKNKKTKEKVDPEFKNILGGKNKEVVVSPELKKLANPPKDEKAPAQKEVKLNKDDRIKTSQNLEEILTNNVKGSSIDQDLKDILDGKNKNVTVSKDVENLLKHGQRRAIEKQIQQTEMKQCADDLNKAMHKIIDEETNKNKPELEKLLRNQVELSFLKFSKAFINAGYYKFANDADKTHANKELISDIEKLYQTKDDETARKAEILNDFFNKIAIGGIQNADLPDIYSVLQEISLKDADEFHIEPSDILILDSLIHYTDGDNKTLKTTKAKDKLLQKMRSVFPQRNFTKADNEALTNQIKKLKDEQKTFEGAKKAFVANAKKRLIDYAKTMDNRCPQYVLNNDEINPDLFAENCGAREYFNNLFGNDSIKDLSPIIESLKNAPVNGDKTFPELAPIKIDNPKCFIKDNKLIINFTASNLPQTKGKGVWSLSCPTCQSIDSFDNNKKLPTLEVMQMIQFNGDLPNELTLSNPEVPNQATVSLKGCTFLKTPDAPDTKEENKEVKAEETKENTEATTPEESEEELEDPDKMLEDSGDEDNEENTKSEEEVVEEGMGNPGPMRFSRPLPGMPTLMPLPAKSFYISPGFM